MSHRIPTRKVPNDEGGLVVASLVASTKPCKLLSLVIYNSGPTQWIQIFESAAVPNNGEVPDLPAIRVLTKTTVNFDFGVNGIDFDALTICNSTTEFDKTLGANDCGIVAILQG